MKLLERIAAKVGFVRSQPRAAAPMRRQYAGAQVSRLTEDWAGAFSSADTESSSSGQRLRARARQLERDNPFVERYLKLLCNNVLGSTGIGLQMKVRDPDRMDGGKIKRGSYDTLANATIESAWYDWARGRNCCVDGHTGLGEIEKLALRSAARDGSMFILLHEGAGKYGLQLECFEADFLREDYNEALPNGNVVRFGVEMTAQRKPVAYHFFNRHPHDTGSVSGGLRAVRVPAERVIHVCRRNRQGQTNGVSWLAPVMMRLKMLDGYEEAELIAARCAASKMGFYVKTMPADYQGEMDNAGNPTQEMQPGVIEDLPMGTTFQTLDPQHPVAAYADFVKAALRGVSSGIGVSYNSLASDLEGVNYSSIRAGLLEEREEWKGIQNWFIETVRTVIFEKWLAMALLSGELKLPNGSALPAAKFDKFNSPEWKPRRWQWVDVYKDAMANVMLIEKGLSSRRQIIAENGGDVEDTFADLSADEDLAENYGLKFPKDVQENPVAAANAAAQDDQE